MSKSCRELLACFRNSLMSSPRTHASWSQDLQNDPGLIRFFWLISLIFVAVGISYLIHHLQADPPVLWRAAMSAAFAVAGLAAMGLLRRQRYVLAFQTIIWSGWIITSAVTVVGGGLYSPNMMIYPLLIFAAGWLLSVRTGMVVAAVSLLASLGFAVAEVKGVLPAVQVVPMGISMTTTAVIIIAATLCTYYFSQSYQRRFEALQKLSVDLSDSKARYERAVTGADDGIWEWTPATGEAYLSPRWKQLLGYENHELPDVQESFFNQVHPEDKARVAEAIRAHFQESEPYRIELRLHCKGASIDGSFYVANPVWMKRDDRCTCRDQWPTSPPASKPKRNSNSTGNTLKNSSLPARPNWLPPGTLRKPPTERKAPSSPT